MAIGDHLEELRKRLIAVAGVSILGAVVAGFFIYPIHDLLVKPYLATVGAGRPQAVLLILRQIPGPLVSLLKLAAMVGLTVTLPISISIVWGFIRPAVSRRVAWTGQVAVLASSGLFWLGIFVCWRLVFPVALQFMLVDVLPSGVSPQLALEDYYSFVFFLHIGAGLGFQLPLLVVILGGLGILTVEWHKRSWRYISVGIFIFSALVTPPDPITQLALAIPLCLLYAVSILIVWVIERGRRRPTAEDEEEDRAP